jgi:hypothetical protein
MLKAEPAILIELAAVAGGAELAGAGAAGLLAEARRRFRLLRHPELEALAPASHRRVMGAGKRVRKAEWRGARMRAAVLETRPQATICAA